MTALRELLIDETTHITPPDLADVAWREGQARVLRRRRVGMASVAGLAAASVVAVAAATGHFTQRHTPTPPATTTSATADHRQVFNGTPWSVAPTLAEIELLPQTPYSLGPELAIPGIVGQDQQPNPVAVTLRQLNDSTYRPVLIRPGGAVQEVPVDLLATHDRAGNKAQPLDSTAVAPGWGLIGIAQPGAAVIIELGTGKVTRVPIPDASLETAFWEQRPDGPRLIVSGETATYGVDVVPASGSSLTTKEPIYLGRPAGGPPNGAGPILTIDKDRPAMARWSSDGTEPLGPLDLPVYEWGWAGSARGDLVARSFYSTDVSALGAKLGVTNPEGIAAVDVRTGKKSMLLIPDDGRSKGDAQVLGWLDDRRVILRVGGLSGADGWLLAWDITTGEVTRLTRLTGVGPLALVPSG